MALPALRTRRSGLRLGGAATVAGQVGLQKLLATRITDLDLEPEGLLAECIEEVTRELRARGIAFAPTYYLGDDDFWTADRAVSVNIPWYLANPTLWRMVNDHLFEYTRREVLMYLRHETGHALNYAFELWRRKDWTQTFGDFRRPYRDVYTPHPRSRDHVRYLHATGMYHYAQKHPDEDWAESFAVWLDPETRWRRRYRDWPVALTKLEYVDRIVDLEGACKGTPPNTRPGSRRPYAEIKETVAEYFDLDHAVDRTLAEYRRDLLQVFPSRPPRPRRGGARPGARHAQSAARFIQQHQRLLTDKITRWIGRTDRRGIGRFLRRLEALCTTDHLVVPETRRNDMLVDLTIMSTWHVVDHVHRLRRRARR